MGLEHYDPEGPTGAAYGWFCGNDWCIQHDDPNGIEDHRYDWLAYGLSDDQLAEVKEEDGEFYKELAAEQAAMRRAYESTKRPKRLRLGR
jgi:hypothetical protein